MPGCRLVAAIMIMLAVQVLMRDCRESSFCVNIGLYSASAFQTFVEKWHELELAQQCNTEIHCGLPISLQKLHKEGETFACALIVLEADTIGVGAAASIGIGCGILKLSGQAVVLGLKQ